MKYCKLFFVNCVWTTSMIIILRNTNEPNLLVKVKLFLIFELLSSYPF